VKNASPKPESFGYVKNVSPKPEGFGYVKKLVESSTSL